jgi:phosphoserine phosphatase
MARSPRFEAVCFDFDSTLSHLEGIDELAKHAGVESQIIPLTAAAMDGKIALDSVYAARLDIIQPDREAVSWLGQRYISEIVLGTDATIKALRRANVAVYIVSGGIRGAILPFAKKCGIPPDCVHAVEIVFDANGSYKDFDRASPLTKADGKAVVCRGLFQRHRTLALVGDGITDVAAQGGGAFVVGFGGVVAREAVRACADRYVAGPDLSDVLDVLFEFGGGASSER